MSDLRPKDAAKPKAVNRPERFHGAFTGGFSAGYFNTVGSEGGWEPSKFVSSRNRTSSHVLQQRPEDFMDEEDGLLGRQIQTKDDFDTLGKSAAAATTKHAAFIGKGSVIPGPVPTELIAPSTNQVGKRLLQQMGWREGQGIGKRRTKRTTGTEHFSLFSSNEDIIPDDIRLKFPGNIVTYAPDNADAKINIPKAKTNIYGIGYDPYKDAPELLAFRSKEIHSDDQQKNRISMSISQQTGIGSSHSRKLIGLAAYDDDGDIYDAAQIEYQTSICDDFLPDSVANSSKFLLLKGSADISEQGYMVHNDEYDSDSMMRLKQLVRCKTDNRLPVTGFLVSSQNLKNSVKSDWIPIEPPEGYIPYHTFTEIENLEHDKRINIVWSGVSKISMTTAYRGVLLGEQKQIQLEVQAGEKINAGVLKIQDSSLKEKMFMPPQFKQLRSAMESRFTGSSENETSVPASVGLKIHVNNTEEPLNVKDNTIKEVSKIQKLHIDIKPTRTSTVWKPAPLLCKRLNVPVPEISKGSRWGPSHLSTSSQKLGHIEVPLLKGFELSSSSTLTSKNVSNTVSSNVTQLLDIDIAKKPPIELFRSIFEPLSESETELENKLEKNEKMTKISERVISEEDITNSSAQITRDSSIQVTQDSSAQFKQVEMPEWAQRAIRSTISTNQNHSTDSKSESDVSVDYKVKRQKESKRKDKKREKNKKQQKKEEKRRKKKREKRHSSDSDSHKFLKQKKHKK